MPRETFPTLLTVLLISLALGVVGWLLFHTISGNQHMSERTAAAVLATPSGKEVGKVTFQQRANGVVVVARAEGLSPGGHALIIHNVGTCQPDFSAAGDHFDVGPNGSDGHAGDLPNILAATDGSMRADFFTDRFTILKDQHNSLFDEDGASIIIHRLSGTQSHPNGPPYGARLACGVIKIEDDSSRM